MKPERENEMEVIRLKRANGIKMAHLNFVSGGSNCHDTCATCLHQVPSPQHNWWGWCPVFEMASVSPTGHCDEHLKLVRKDSQP